MSASLVEAKVRELTDDQISLIKQTVCKEATDTELKLFLYHCTRTGLDPLAKQIYFQKRRNRKTGKDDITIMTGIDGYRLVADRTGQYAGNDDPVFDDEENPKKATVTVYKVVSGIRCPFSATARWDQYFPGDMQGFMWRKMPHLMLGKCAEALALRKAFPNEISGIYTKEEMDQASDNVIDSEASDLQPNYTYIASDSQKQLFAQYCNECGVKNPEIIAKMSEHLKNRVGLNQLKDAIKELLLKGAKVRVKNERYT